MNLAFIGIGKVGFALANNLSKKGHTITIAHNNIKSESVLSAQAKNSSFLVAPIQEAIEACEVIFLATPFKLNEAILSDLDFKNKILVDCTNPVGVGVSHGLESKISGAEKVKEWSKNAKVVKSYSVYGFENLEDSTYPNYSVKPAMFIAGDDVESKQKITSLNSDLGFYTLDAGGLSQALHLEHMTLLWVKMVRVNKHHPHFSWAYVER